MATSASTQSSGFRVDDEVESRDSSLHDLNFPSLMREGQGSGSADTDTIEWENVACLMCGALDHELLVEAPDYLTRIGGVFRVVRCRCCRLAYTNPRPTAARIGCFYPTGYSPHEGHSPDDGWRGRLRRKLERAVLRCDLGYSPAPRFGTAAAAAIGRLWIRNRRRRAAWIAFRPGGRLLDFGCGAGQFLGRMRDLGWNAEGVDTSAAVAGRVRHDLGASVHVGSLPHADVSPSSLDVVTMWSSLEHVHQPREVVRSARDALKPGGLLIASVPNFASWPARTFGRAWYGLDLPRHLTHFTPESLTELLRRERFRVQRIEHIARDGWLRHSIMRASQLGIASRPLRACHWKPLARTISRWNELTEHADCVVAWAERS
jgi:2-polyprenyl-3-methyl-5-hydroxy-6-metoxy-1,4-benzoquinol methylase